MGLPRGRMAEVVWRAGLAAALLFVLPVLDAATCGAWAAAPQTGRQSSEASKSKYGVLVNTPKAFPGYNLLAPIGTTMTYLVDLQGRVVHTWESEYDTASGGFLLPNGHLLRAAHIDNHPLGTAPGRGGRVQEFNWEGELLWDFKFPADKGFSHHDLCKLPNGNVLLIVRTKKGPEEVAAAGGKAAVNIFVDSILEVRPTGKTTGEVVWEWHVWDHLIQGHDKTKANYGVPAAHPERIDINSRGRDDFFASLNKNKSELKKLQALGYVGQGSKLGRVTDWTHINSVTYNAERDQVMLSVPQFSEVWIIDHSTSKAEAAGRSGGRYGKGGDVLYRWGNPRNYGAGAAKDVQLFFQHDASWIPQGCPGAGHLLVFNNGQKRPAGPYSSVDEIVLPVNKDGSYEHKPGAAFGPERPIWTYTAPSKFDFVSRIMGGAQRQPNGNTLICASTTATIFEVTPEGEIVWKLVTPPLQARKGTSAATQKAKVEFTPEQTKQLERVQKDVSAKFEKLLTETQKRLLKKMQASADTLPLAGQILVPFVQGGLRLTADQKEQVNELKKEALGQLRSILTPAQREPLQKLIRAFRPGGSSGRRAGGAPSLGACFRVYRYVATYPGLVGRDLTPGPTLQAVYAKEEKSR
jgi:hypothetical protein